MKKGGIMLNLKITCTCLLIVLEFLIMDRNAFSQEKLKEFDIKFSNSIYLEHFSNFLDNDVRADQATVNDDPSLYLNEKFQVFFLFFNRKKSDNISFGYASVNIIYTHNENYAVRSGIEIEGGLGDYKNPWLSAGMGLTYQKDMVFDYKEYAKLHFISNIGHRDDIHFFFNFDGVLNDAGGEDTTPSRSYYDIDIALGYKRFLPAFLRYNMFATFNETEIYKKNNLSYTYYHEVAFTHLQYNGDNFGVSMGYIYNKEEYQKVIYNDDQTEEDLIQLGYKKSQGGGLTFFAKIFDSSLEVFGEFHLLADRNMDWMTISKLGVKAYF